MTKQKQKLFTVFGIAVVVVLALAVGMHFGQDQGEKQTKEELFILIDHTYPKPPETMLHVGGTIRGVGGGIIDLEIIDPDDYLPHADGSPQKREVRFAFISSATEVVLIDYTNPGLDGAPSTTLLTLADLKTGDTVTVKSEQNIRDAKEFDVYRVEIIRY